MGTECVTVKGEPIFVLVQAKYGWFYAWIYGLTMVLMTFGLFNVIVALYVENTVEAAKFSSLSQKRKRLLDDQFFAEKATELVEFVWRVHRQEKRRVSIQMTDCEALQQLNITPDLFETLRSFREFQNILNDLDISDEDQLDLFDTLDVDGGGTIDLEELIVGISKLRGDARRSDIIGVSLIVRNIQSALITLADTAEQ